MVLKTFVADLLMTLCLWLNKCKQTLKKGKQNINKKITFNVNGQDKITPVIYMRCHITGILSQFFLCSGNVALVSFAHSRRSFLALQR